MIHLSKLVLLSLLFCVPSCSPPAEQQARWNLRTTLGQYEKTGRRDPKWDAAAKEALRLYAHWRSAAAGRSPEQARQISERCREAMGAGCPDPLVLYVLARFVVNQPGNTDAEIASAHRQVAAGLKASGYCSVRKFYGFLRAGEHLHRLDPVPKLEVAEMMNDAAVQLSLAFKEKAAPAAELDQAARAFMEVSHGMKINRNWGWARLEPALRKQWGANYAEELSRGETKVD